MAGAAAARRDAGAGGGLGAVGGAAGDFPLVAQGQAARIVTDPVDDAVVRIAADDLKQDIGRVTGAAEGGAAQVWIGTLGHNQAIDRLVADKRIDVAKLKGAWESFLILPVERYRRPAWRARC
ncbi:hypothetical protein ACFSUK_19860 [Sphingobium scionense]